MVLFSVKRVHVLKRRIQTDLSAESECNRAGRIVGDGICSDS